MVQHYIRHGIALQFDHHAHAVTVALIAQIGNSLNPFSTHRLGNLFDHAGFVHLIGHLRDDDGFPILADGLYIRAAAHDDGTAPGAKRRQNAGPAQNYTPGWKIWALDEFQQTIDGNFAVIEIGAAGIDDLAQIMGWYIGRHADGDAARAIGQQVRQHGR